MYSTPSILELATTLFPLDIHFVCVCVCVFFFHENLTIILGPFDNGAQELQVVQCLVFCSNVLTREHFLIINPGYGSSVV